MEDSDSDESLSDCGETFHQRETITTRISNILVLYPDGEISSDYATSLNFFLLVDPQ